MSSKQTRKQKKPRLIAYARHGLYGDIHYPALPCDDPSRTPTPVENYISKSMQRSQAMTEIAKTRDLRHRNFDFALIPDDFCEGRGTLRQGKGSNRKSLGQKRYLLFSKYGGLTVRETTKEMLSQARRIVNYVQALEDLRTNVKQMNAEKFFHNDINDMNITYDESKEKAFLIDFEHTDRISTESFSPSETRSGQFINDESVVIDNSIQYLLGELGDIGLYLHPRHE